MGIQVKRLSIKYIFRITFLLLFVLDLRSQPLSQIKKELETTSDPIGYVKFKLKKKYFIDTISIVTYPAFRGFADSLAYRGKVGKVYGPFKNQKILIRILVKVPNMFYHIQHILLDTTTFPLKMADTMANSIMQKIRNGSRTFASMASTFSTDLASASNGGDLGWFVAGVMMPELDIQMTKRKKGDIFKVRTSAGVHIVRIADQPKKDDGFALLLRVIL